MDVINERTRRDLEFDKVLTRVRRGAASPLGQEAVDRLRPYPNRAGAEAEVARVRDCIEAVKEHRFVVPRVEDLRPTLTRAGEATTVAPEEFLPVLEGLEAVRRLQGTLSAFKELDALRALGGELESFPELEGFIRRSVDENGQIRDDASPALRELTRKRATSESRARKKLEGILNSASHSGVIQESVITQRSGRLVIPVKAHLRHQMSGIVQDSSGSGQTLYLEPASVVEDNNRVRELDGEIRDEKLRILQALTEKLRQESPAVRKALDAYARIDSVCARARYALDAPAHLPELNDDGYLRLKKARHPLLDAEAVVPIDLSLGERHRGVIVTGPNTGGKTVALKTVGLMTLMAQSAIPIPAAEGSAVSTFRLVRSDIGDEQSIEQNLSTFSSHLRNIAGILADLETCQDDEGLSLVILDEIGAGTDPQEGTALAVALLRRLLEGKVRLLVTTHYGALKRFAYNDARLKNASVEFDLETLSPTYRLLEGVPGSSNAFQIAERLGLGHDLIQAAKGTLDEGEVRAEDVIRQLQAERAELERERSGFQEAKRGLEDKVRRYQRKYEQLEDERERELGEEIHVLEDELANVRQTLEHALHATRERRSEETLRAELRDVLAAGAELEKARGVLEQRTGPRPLESLEALATGQRVQVRGFRKPGRVLRVEDEGRIQVEIDGVRVWAKFKDLSAAEGTQEASEPATVKLKARTERGEAAPPLELDVRGQTAAEAVRAVDHYMNQLLLADRSEGAILHGKGTGALRRAVRDHLKTLDWIKDAYAAPPSQGGDGVTVVEL